MIKFSCAGMSGLTVASGSGIMIGVSVVEPPSYEQLALLVVDLTGKLSAATALVEETNVRLDVIWQVGGLTRCLCVVSEPEEAFVAKLAGVRPFLDERQWRLLLGAEVESIGWGGIALVARLSGASRTTVQTG